ncbi:MAG: hypothetical protein DDG60_13030 [Anaerolineae bacterium]|nr:MAG: hypothetical protein DDG60_13030 [Anaerolineae bacterium]
MLALAFFWLVSCGGMPGNLPVFSSPEPVVSATPTFDPAIPPEYLTQAALPRTIPPPPTEIPTETPTPTITPSLTPSITPSSTRTPRLFSPAALGTQVIDMGYQPITLEGVSQLIPIWQTMKPVVRQAVPSGDNQKLFISTANGLFVFDQSGAQLAHWFDVFTHARPCKSCLTVNREGTLFAVLTRNAGRWEAQVYEVRDTRWKNLRLSIPLEAAYRGQENEGLVLLSPDGNFLAYAAGDSALRVFNLNNGRQVLTSDKPLRDLQFSANSALLAARDGRNLLIYDTQTWQKPVSLLLPANDTPFALSPDAGLLAITFSNRLRMYSLQTLKTAREVTVPDGKPRAWELTFLDENRLQGRSVSWNAARTQATIITAEWEALSGKNLRFETSQTSSPSPYPATWPQEVALPDLTNGLGVGEYNGFRYITSEMLLVGTSQAVCWVKIFSGEQNCFSDPQNRLFSTDTIALKEIVQEKRTLLQNWRGEAILDVFGDYRVRAVDRSGEWVVIDVRGAAADLYAKGRSRASESVGGAFQAFAETRTLFAYTTQQKSKTFVITIFDKASGKTLAQQKDVFLLSPLLLNRQGTLFLLKRDLDKGQVIVQAMQAPRYTIREVKRLSLPAEVQTFTYSTKEDLLAFALADGSVWVYSSDFEVSQVFQAADSPVTALAFSPDDRFLAIASAEGVRVFAVRP